MQNDAFLHRVGFKELKVNRCAAEAVYIRFRVSFRENKMPLKSLT